MKRAIGLSAVLMIGCVTGAAVRDIVAPVRAQGQTGPNYQYDVVHVMNSAQNDKEALAKYGAQGWRLVATAGDTIHRNLYFERQVSR